MQIQYDPEKDEKNIDKHGISLRQADYFSWPSAKIAEDKRHDYGERRFIATGKLGVRLYVVVFVERRESIRIISMRKANKREQRNYEKK